MQKDGEGACNRTVGFCEGFILCFFGESRGICELNFCCLHAKQKSHISIHPTLNYLAANTSMSVIVPLMAVSEKIVATKITNHMVYSRHDLQLIACFSHS